MLLMFVDVDVGFQRVKVKNTQLIKFIVNFCKLVCSRMLTSQKNAMTVVFVLTNDTNVHYRVINIRKIDKYN